MWVIQSEHVSDDKMAYVAKATELFGKLMQTFHKEDALLFPDKETACRFYNDEANGVPSHYTVEEA